MARARPHPGFPPQPPWFRDNRDFGNIERGLSAVGFGAENIAKFMGGNWYRFFETSFGLARRHENPRTARAAAAAIPRRSPRTVMRLARLAPCINRGSVSCAF